LLEKSVQMYLVSDVPLGIFLSGGMDSSAITALAAKHASGQLNTLCVSFDEQEFSEDKYAADIANRFNCKHVEVRLRATDFIDEIPHFLSAMDQPTVDGINTYFVAKAAKAAGLTVVLSGLGGDEIFWGYSGFHTGPRIFRWLKIPGARLGVALISAFARRFGYNQFEKSEFLCKPGALGTY